MRRTAVSWHRGRCASARPRLRAVGAARGRGGHVGPPLQLPLPPLRPYCGTGDLACGRWREPFCRREYADALPPAGQRLLSSPHADPTRPPGTWQTGSGWVGRPGLVPARYDRTTGAPQVRALQRRRQSTGEVACATITTTADSRCRAGPWTMPCVVPERSGIPRRPAGSFPDCYSPPTGLSTTL